MADEPGVSDYERFKWDILGDAVWEDYQGLWEPLWWLRGGGSVEGQSEAERQDLAERALRELYGDGLIYFFRVPRGDEINRAGEDEKLRLTADEADAALRYGWWRGTDGLPEGHPDIWFGPTPEGEAACEKPPDAIRRMWRLDADEFRNTR